MRVLLDSKFLSHKKLYALARVLSISRDQAAIHLIRLWLWAIENRENGRLDEVSHADLTGIVGCKDGKEFAVALESERWVDLDGDTMILHDWLEHQGKLIRERERDRIRKHEEYELEKLKKRRKPPKASPVETPAETPKVPPPAPYPLPVPLPLPVPSPAETSPPNPLKGEVRPFTKEERLRAEALALTVELVDLWNHGRADGSWIGVTPIRVSKVKARLGDGFTATQLRQAVASIKESEFHSGVNDRGWACPGPEWVFRSYEKCEEWVNKRAAPPPVKRDSYLESMENVKRMFLGGDGKEKKA